MKCPICTEELKDFRKEISDEYQYLCPRCGEFKLTRTLAKVVENWEDGVWRWIVSYHIRSMNINNREVELDTNNIEYLKNQKMPRPIEQAENFIRILGDAIEIPSKTLQINAQDFASFIGANNISGVDYIGEHLSKKGLAIYKFLGQGMPDRSMGLTMEGWEYYDDLKSGHAKSNLAFMAMKFNHDELDEFYNNHVKLAIEELGFELRRLYAEGHGKPVIYLCRKDYFDKFKTHFDTNHHTTIIWSQDTFADDMNRLKSTIKNTFPELLYRDKK